MSSAFNRRQSCLKNDRDKNWYSKVQFSRNRTCAKKSNRSCRRCSKCNVKIFTTMWRLWLWRWLPHRLSKRQSLPTTTVLFRTTFTQTIELNLLLKWVLGSNLSQCSFCYNLSKHCERKLLATFFSRPIPLPFRLSAFAFAKDSNL